MSTRTTLGIHMREVRHQIHIRRTITEKWRKMEWWDQLQAINESGSTRTM